MQKLRNGIRSTTGASQDNAGIGSVVSGVVGGGIGGASGYGLLRGMGKLVVGPAKVQAKQ